MQLKEVIGRRRSIHFYLPFRPVEREKVQKMLEAARRASCVGKGAAPPRRATRRYARPR